MKTCLDCGKDLPTALDEFGELGSERCQSCFLEHQWTAPSREATVAEEEIAELEGEIEELEGEIDGLEEEISEKEDDINDKRDRIAELQKVVDAAPDYEVIANQGEITCP